MSYVPPRRPSITPIQSATHVPQMTPYAEPGIIDPAYGTPYATPYATPAVVPTVLNEYDQPAYAAYASPYHPADELGRGRSLRRSQSYPRIPSRAASLHRSQSRHRVNSFVVPGTPYVQTSPGVMYVQEPPRSHSRYRWYWPRHRSSHRRRHHSHSRSRSRSYATYYPSGYYSGSGSGYHHSGSGEYYSSSRWGTSWRRDALGRVPGSGGLLCGSFWTRVRRIRFRPRGACRAGVTIRSAENPRPGWTIANRDRYTFHDLTMEGRSRFKLRVAWPGYSTYTYDIPLDRHPTRSNRVDLQSLLRRVARSVREYFETNRIPVSWERIKIIKIEDIGGDTWRPGLKIRHGF